MKKLLAVLCAVCLLGSSLGVTASEVNNSPGSRVPAVAVTAPSATIQTFINNYPGAQITLSAPTPAMLQSAVATVVLLASLQGIATNVTFNAKEKNEAMKETLDIAGSLQNYEQENGTSSDGGTSVNPDNLSIVMMPQMITLDNNGETVTLPNGGVRASLAVTDLNYSKPVYVFQIIEDENGNTKTVRVEATIDPVTKQLIVDLVDASAPFVIAQDLTTGLPVTGSDANVDSDATGAAVADAVKNNSLTLSVVPATSEAYKKRGKDDSAAALEEIEKTAANEDATPEEIDQKVKDAFVGADLPLDPDALTPAVFPQMVMATDASGAEVALPDGPLQLNMSAALNYDQPIYAIQLLEDENGLKSVIAESRTVETPAEEAGAEPVKSLQVDLADVNSPFIIAQDLTAEQ